MAHLPSSGLLEIDLAAIGANYRDLQARTFPGRCAGVVKADAYGLGAARVLPVLHAHGCRDFFVAHLDEALALRPLTPADSTLYVLNGLTRAAAPECAEAGIVPVLNAPGQIAVWQAEARRRQQRLPAVLQVDTGMSRLGLAPAEVDEVADHGLEGIDLRLVMSHLACADERESLANAQQLAVFHAARARLGKAIAGAGASFANSSGIFLGRDYHFDLARPGAALYGINPTPVQDNPMRAVVRLKARVIQTRDISEGAHVGYGYAYACAGRVRVATLSVGYADGWHRALSSQGAAWFGEYRLPILGRVSMDSMSVDISGVPEVLIGPDTAVELIGPLQTVDDVARAAGTIGYEILTSLGHRYERIYHDADAGEAR